MHSALMDEALDAGVDLYMLKDAGRERLVQGNPRAGVRRQRELARCLISEPKATGPAGSFDRMIGTYHSGSVLRLLTLLVPFPE